MIPEVKENKKEIGKPCWRTLNGIIIIIAAGVCVCVFKGKQFFTGRIEMEYSFLITRRSKVE